MKFLFNNSNSQVDIFIKDQPTKIGPGKAIPLNNDGKSMADAQAWCSRFTCLQITDKDQVDRQNQLLSQPGVASTSVSALPVAASAPQIQTILNEVGDKINIYKLPIYNSAFELVDSLGVMYNEDAGKVTISTQSDLVLTLVDKTKKVAIKAAPVTEVVGQEIFAAVVDEVQVSPVVEVPVAEVKAEEAKPASKFAAKGSK